MRLKLSILFVLAVINFCFAQNGKRYLDEIFSSYRLQSDIIYGTGSKNIMDVYTGTDDKEFKRPLVIFIHGGGFKDGDKVSNFGTRVCAAFAKRGYVVASINYRLTSTQNTPQQSFQAMIKAVQDAKAAVRFFKKNAADYNVDTTQIFATGSSAGSITALHMAYLDPTELPDYITDPALKDLEGASGNQGYSSKINGVISNWGAIGDTSWIKKGDVPVFCVHGLNDVTVYFEKVPADEPFNFGSKHVYDAALRKNLKSGLRTFVNTGHTLDNSSAKQDSAINDFTKWLYSVLRKETTGSIDYKNSIPSTTHLKQNYPNPFNPVTQIEYELSKPDFINLTIYDSLGRMVKTLVNKYSERGIYRVSFDGEEFASGIYISMMKGTNYTYSKKMILQK